MIRRSENTHSEGATIDSLVAISPELSNDSVLYNNNNCNTSVAAIALKVNFLDEKWLQFQEILL